MCFEVICCLELSKISGSAVNTLTAVINRRELGLPPGCSLLKSTYFQKPALLLHSQECCNYYHSFLVH